jgi:hypothetical protein
MDHVLVDASSTRIAARRPHPEIVVSERAPNGEDFDSFGVVGVDQEVVSHGYLAASCRRWSNPTTAIVDADVKTGTWRAEALLIADYSPPRL